MYELRNAIQRYFYPDWPKSASMEDWGKWHEQAKKRKVAYWLTKTMPTWFAVKGMQLDDIRYWFKYRLQKRHRYHLIDTGLKPSYHEIETRMLHGMFNMLKDFVEIEKAQLHYYSLKKGSVRPSPKEAGLLHLEWEISLTHDKDMMDHVGTPELIGKPTDQAIAAQQVKDLYIWWIDERPFRIDPWDAEFERRKENKEDVRPSIYKMWVETSDEEKATREKFFKEKEDIEEDYEREDNQMLYALISLRGSLWT